VTAAVGVEFAEQTVSLHQLLVEVLDREVRLPLDIQAQHQLDLGRRRTTTRHPANPPIRQTILASLSPALAPTPERPLCHPNAASHPGQSGEGLRDKPLKC
jgi:hypothetical protein